MFRYQDYKQTKVIVSHNAEIKIEQFMQKHLNFLWIKKHFVKNFNFNELEKIKLIYKMNK